MDPDGPGCGDAAYDLALGVPDHHEDRGILGSVLGPQFVPGGVGKRFAGGCLGSLPLPPLVAQAQDVFLQVVGDHRPEGRVGCGEEGVAPLRFFAAAERVRLHVHPWVLHREHRAVAGERLGREMAQGRVVVEDEEAPPERGRDEVVLARLDLQIPDRDGRQPPLQPNPVRAAVDGREESELGAQEEQPFLPRVLDHRPGELVLGKVAGDVIPGDAAVVAAHHVGREIALLVVVEDRVHRVLPVPGGMEIRHVGEGRNARNGIHRPPLDPPVIADLDAAVVHPGVEQPFDEG